jgi:hypothetical protein
MHTPKRIKKPRCKLCKSRPAPGSFYCFNHVEQKSAEADRISFAANPLKKSLWHSTQLEREEWIIRVIEGGVPIRRVAAESRFSELTIGKTVREHRRLVERLSLGPAFMRTMRKPRAEPRQLDPAERRERKHQKNVRQSLGLE